MILCLLNVLYEKKEKISHNGTTSSIRLCCCGKSSVLDAVWLYVKPFVLSVFCAQLDLIGLILVSKSTASVV